MISKLLKRLICITIVVLLLYNILKNNVNTKTYKESVIKFDELDKDNNETYHSNERSSIWYNTDWMKALPIVNKHHSPCTVVSDINRYSGYDVLMFISSNHELMSKIKEYGNVSKCTWLNEVSNQNIEVTPTKTSPKYIKWSSLVGLSPMYVGYRQDDGYIDVTWKNDYKKYDEVFLDKHKILLTTNKKTKDVTIISGSVLVLQHFDDGNIFHQFKNSGILFYLLSQSQLSKNVSVIMTATSSILKSSQIWIEAAAAQLINLIDAAYYADKTLLFDDIYKLEPVFVSNKLIFSDFLTLNQNPVPDMLALRNKLISTLPAANTKYVLLLYRHPRYLVDSNTRTFNTIVEEMCKMHLNVKVANFESTSPREQQILFRNAAVVVAVHGSELTNLIYLDPASIVIEVTLRYGWCCDPIPLKNQGLQADPCTGNCRAYHKWDFANLAHSLDLKYLYFDPTYIDPPHAANPIARNEVHVNSKDLALLVRTALVIVDPDFASFQKFLEQRSSQS